MEAGLPQAIHSAEKSYESCWNFTKTQDGKRDWYIIAGERKRPGEKERAVTHKKKIKTLSKLKLSLTIFYLPLK